MKHSVRKMADTDLPKVSDLLRGAYAVLAEREGLSAEEGAALFEQRGSVDALRAQTGEYEFFVLEREGELAGVLALKGNEVTKLFVHPGFLRRGIGAGLFEMAQRTVARAGFEEILLGTTGHAVAFYRAMGMVVTGTSPAASGPLKGRQVTIMRKPLCRTNTTRRLANETDLHL
ncbi:MAG: GNAT family N-acetyltransferase [Planctomycetes bacterium]|jgi:N-acetylglutamate synthase-like GNAT family acetyltransferase|nr:GNAT family N-acetyltransferase [Planctomycetota bacterium]